MSLALTQEKGLLPLAVGEGFPLQKLFALFHLQDFPPGPFPSPVSRCPPAPGAGMPAPLRRLQSSYKQHSNSPPHAKN